MATLYKIPPEQNTAPFDRAPYLSPWYFDKEKPRLTPGSNVLSWTFVEKLNEEYAGVLTLTSGEKLLGLVDTNVYVHPSPAGDTFCTWERGTAHSPHPVIQLFRTADLQPFEDKEAAILNIIRKRPTVHYSFNCPPLATVSFELPTNKETFMVKFPIEFKTFPEFMYVTGIKDLYPNGNPDWYNSAIIVVTPNEDKVSVYPQDWFNQSNRDFGYQWITRAVRNPDNNGILGQGIRMSKFELDETNRQVKTFLT